MTDAEIELYQGHHVRVTGLVNATELNGQEGALVSWDAAESRWNVAMLDSESWDKEAGKKLRVRNLEIVAAFSPGQCVCFRNLVNRMDLNGQEGTLIAWSSREQRWHVRILDGTGMSIKVNKMTIAIDFTPGKLVRVVGMQNYNDVHGQTGILVFFDGQLWVVRMADGSERRVPATEMVLDIIKVVQLFATMAGPDELLVSGRDIGGDEIVALPVRVTSSLADLKAQIAMKLFRPVASLKCLLPGGQLLEETSDCMTLLVWFGLAPRETIA